MQALCVIEAQRAGDRVEHAVRGAVDVAAFELCVVVDADSGEAGDLCAAEPPYPSRPGLDHPQAGLIGSDLGPAGHQEVADFRAAIHHQRLLPKPCLGGARSPPVMARFTSSVRVMSETTTTSTPTY